MAVQQYGGATDITILLSTKRYNDLVKGLQSQARFETVKNVRGTVGFETLVVSTNGTTAKVIADRFLNLTECYCYDRDAIEFVSWGAAPAVVETAGFAIYPMASALGFEGRIASYCNFIPMLPAATANLLLPST
jgi:hypothetical protein